MSSATPPGEATPRGASRHLAGESAQVHHDLADLLTRAEEIDHDLEQLIADVWDHVPALPECERPCGAASIAVANLVHYLAEHKEARNA